MPHDPDQNVLFRLMTVEEAAQGLGVEGSDAQRRLSDAMNKLRAVRERRPRPKVDPALYSSINGGFIRGLARSSAVTESAPALASARKAADRFLRQAYFPDRGVGHRLEGHEAAGFGLLEDQVEFALGLLELATVTQHGPYLEAAKSILGIVDSEFRDDSGLLRDVAPKLYDGARIGSIEAASFPIEDNPHLSANAAGVLAFERLGSVTGDERWMTSAAITLEPLMTRLRDAGLFAAGAALGAGLLDTPAARVVIEGTGPEADALYRAARTTWYPNLSVFRGAPEAPFSLPEELGVATGSSAKVRALVCFGTRCLAPITKPDALSAAIRGGGAGATA